jgi:hypothetical protein
LARGIVRNRRESLPDSLPAVTRPIELLTENGFTILRLWEIDRDRPPTAGKYTFMVRNPSGLEREVMVEIANEIVVDVELKTMRRVRSESAYWMCCAERHLATYVWENDDCPPGDRLCVNRLIPEDVMSAIRWGAN